MKYRQIIAILEQHDFKLVRHGATSHRQYEGTIDGERKMVTVSGRDGEDIKPKNLASMKRQSLACDIAHSERRDAHNRDSAHILRATCASC